MTVVSEGTVGVGADRHGAGVVAGPQASARGVRLGRGVEGAGEHDAPALPQAGEAFDPRAWGAAGEADPRVVRVWHAVLSLASEGPGPMGLAAGERPIADVEVLAGMLAAAEYAVARFVRAGVVAGCAPLAGRGALLTARGWSGPWAHRLARAAQFADEHPATGEVWAAGTITADHLDAIVRNRGTLTGQQVEAILAELDKLWGRISPFGVEQLVRRAAALLHPPEPDPDDPVPKPDDAELAGYESRFLSFATLGDTTLIQGRLPRIEGELVQAAIDAIAETLRTTEDDLSASARRADALVQLVNAAHAGGTLPARGGLPVALTVTLERTSCGDPVWTTSRGHSLTPNEEHFVSCDAAITPILVRSACTTPPPEPRSSPVGSDRPSIPWDRPARQSDALRDVRPGVAACDTHHRAPVPDPSWRPPDPGSFSDAARISALAALMFDPREPIAVGRTHRTATPAQRRALAARDRGCIIPGCAVPAEACQAHHLTGWAEGGSTAVANLALLCWAHHRQVDLRLWTITPTTPVGGSDDAASNARGSAEQSTAVTPLPSPGSGPGASSSPRSTARLVPRIPWPANNGAPFTIMRTPRSRWRT